MKILISGGCGFLGTNLAIEALRRKSDLSVIDNLSKYGSSFNLRELRKTGQFSFYNIDVCDGTAVSGIVKKIIPDVIFHLAGQVAMTSSIARPRLDFETNVLGTLNILESVREFSPGTAVLYASTNKVYGDLEAISYRELPTRYIVPEFPEGFGESVPLDFRSPYGCSKGAAEQYVLDYHRTFGLNTVVFRHSSMFGTRQFACADQGWIGWFCGRALKIKNRQEVSPFTIAGNGKQVRDILYADDMVDLYFRAVDRLESISGHAFNIGGGPLNSFSLLELFNYLEDVLDIRMNYRETPWRKSDQKVFIANIAKAKEMIDWKPETDKYVGIDRMLNWLKEQND